MGGADERSRIARELHDVVAHAVSVMTVQTAAVRRLLEPEQEREREALESVEQTGRAALVELRRLEGLLAEDGSPADLSPAPGLERLHALVDRAHARGLRVELALEGEPRPLAAGVDVCAYRIVEKALAGALSEAAVTLRFGEDALALEIARDGAADDLDGVRERVLVCSGRVEIGPRSDGGGSFVRATLPVESPS